MADTLKVTREVYAMKRMDDAEIGGVLAEIERQKTTKKDYVADTRKLHATVADGEVLVSVPAAGEDTLLKIKPTARRQMAAHFKVPSDYFLRLLEDAKHQPLAAATLNHFFDAEPSKRLIRTLDGAVRSFHSNTYRPLDNADLFFNAYEELEKIKAELWFARLTDDSFRLYAVNPGTWAEVTTKRRGLDLRDFPGGEGGGTAGAPDRHHPAISIDNSETGCGGLHVRAADVRAACLNLNVTDVGVMSIHRGSRKEDEGFLSQETLVADSKVVWMKVRDLIKATFDQKKFQRMIDLMNGATLDEVEDVVKVVDALAAAYYIPEDVKGSIRNRFIKSPDKTRYGLINSVTFEAHNTGLSDDTKNLLEDVGGKLLETTIEKVLVAATSK